MMRFLWLKKSFRKKQKNCFLRNEWYNIDKGETKDEINKKKIFTRYD